MEMAFCVVKCLSVRLGKQRVIVSKKNCNGYFVSGKDGYK